MDNKVLKEKNTPALLGFIFSLTFLWIPGLILSIIGLATSKGYKRNRKGLAIAGLIISSLAILFFIILAATPSDPTTNSTNTSNSTKTSTKNKKKLKDVEVLDFSNTSKEEVEEWCNNNNMNCVFSEEYSDDVENGKLISQTDAAGKVLKEDSQIGFVYSLGHKMTQEELNMYNRQQSKDIDYRDALRNPSNYSNQHVHWFGKVNQVVGKSGPFKEYLVYVNCEKNSYASGGYICNDGIYLSYYGDLNLIEDDIVDIWGTMDDPYTYTTVLGSSKTVPKVLSVDVEIK